MEPKILRLVFRFVNSVTTEPFDEKKTWKALQKVAYYVQKNFSSSEENCSTWLNDTQIELYTQDLYESLNILNMSNNTVRNLSMINLAADMYVQLHVCPNNEKRKTWREIYGDLIRRSTSASGLLASLFRIMKRFPGDGQVLAEAMLRKLERSVFKKKMISDSDNITGMRVFLHFLHCLKKYSLGENLFHTVSNHPVHIMGNGRLSPSAFIPFCSFGEDLNSMGIKIEQFKHPHSK